MAAEDNQEISLNDEAQGASKKKLIIIIVAAVLLLGGGVVAYFLLMGGDSSSDQTAEQMEDKSADNSENSGIANYVAMPRPFVFNVMDGKRDRLVQIKVQLMVRGNNNEILARKHVPLLEGTLLQVFGGASAEQLRNPEGKDKLRESALRALNDATMKLEGKAIIDSVLFTGFVLQ